MNVKRDSNSDRADPLAVSFIQVLSEGLALAHEAGIVVSKTSQGFISLFYYK